MDIHQNNDNFDTSLNDQNYDTIDNSVDKDKLKIFVIWQPKS